MVVVAAGGGGGGWWVVVLVVVVLVVAAGGGGVGGGGAEKIAEGMPGPGGYPKHLLQTFSSCFCLFANFFHFHFYKRNLNIFD